MILSVGVVIQRFPHDKLPENPSIEYPLSPKNGRVKMLPVQMTILPDRYSLLIIS